MTQTPPTGPSPRPLSRPDERTWAIMAHIGPLLVGIVTAGSLGFAAPLVIWLALRDRSAFVADQAKEALNFQITLLVGQVVGWLTVWLLVGWLVLAAVWVLGIVFAIVAAVTVNRYEPYRYPLTLRLVR